MKKVIGLIIVCTIIISGLFIYSKSDNRTVLEDDGGFIIAAVIDGKASTTFPTTDGYTASVECTRNGVVQDVGAKVTWSNSKWVVSIDDIGTSNVRCNATFITGIPTFSETILADNEVKTPLTTPGKAISTESEALLASAEDDYGTSYYFRGAVKNNYVQFANKCWRIVRITGDGSVKIVLHNDNTSNATNPCSSTNNSANAAFARYSGTTYKGVVFNSDGDVNSYIGLRYGISSTNYATEHSNINKSSILINLEDWYKKNNLDIYESKLADTIWCNDKSTVSGDLGYGTNRTNYAAYDRLVSTKTPSLICPNDNNGGKLSKFTVNDITNGNGDLTYKIGLLTADEIAFAGYIYGADNQSTYLQENTGIYWWTMSPCSFTDYPSIWAVMSNIGFEGFEGYNLLDYDFGLRPAISLVSSTTVSGSGTSEDPYVVS